MEGKEGHDKVIIFSKDQNVILNQLEKSLIFYFFEIIALPKSYVMEFIPLELCGTQNTSLLCFTFNGLKRLDYHLDSKRSILRIHQDLKIYWNFCIVT